MTIPTFRAPNPDEVALVTAGELAAAIRSYRASTTMLPSGIEVRPNLRCARNTLLLARDGIVAEVIVAEGGYHIVDREADLREEARLRARDARFVVLCANMGLVDARQVEVFTCEHCGTRHSGVMYYAPDCGGDPTPVLFDGDVTLCPVAIA